MVTFIQNRILKPGMVSHFTRSRGTKAFITLPEARTFGIIADVRSPGSMVLIAQFARAVHKPERKGHVILLIPDKRKELVPFDYEKHFPGMPVELICQDEMTLFKAPKRDLIDPFISSRFDIVFYLETAPNFSLESILFHSHAKMFAGATGLCNGKLDFEIDLNDRTEISYLAENLIKYLQAHGSNPEKKTSESDTFTLF